MGAWALNYARRVWRGMAHVSVKGEVEFKRATVEGDRVVMHLVVPSVDATLTFSLSPEAAWLVGNRLVDAGHEASENRGNVQLEG